MIKKSKDEIEKNSIEAVIFDLKNTSLNLKEFEFFNQQQEWQFDSTNAQQMKKNFSYSFVLSALKILVDFLDKLENFKNIIYGSSKIWIDVDFKEECFANLNFINDLEKTLEYLLITALGLIIGLTVLLFKLKKPTNDPV